MTEQDKIVREQQFIHNTDNNITEIINIYTDYPEEVMFQDSH